MQRGNWTLQPLAGAHIAIAETDRARLGIFVRALQGANQIVFEETTDADRIIRMVQAGPCDVLALSADHADDALASAFDKVVRATDVPILVFVTKADASAATSFIRKGASAFVVDGLSEARLPPIFEAARERYRLINALREELVKSKDELSARKMIERAKGLVMQQQGLTESEAYDAMRRLAMARGHKLGDVAETIVTMSEALSKRPH